MQIFRWIMITVVVLALVNPTEAFLGGDPIGRRKIFRDSIRNKKREPNAKAACKAAFGLGCSIAASVSTVALIAVFQLFGSLLGAISHPSILEACRVRRQQCKRSVTSGEILFPFSDAFTDYDLTEDKRISYEEFESAIKAHFPMVDPEELEEPFISADLNDDDYMDMDEFEDAPFLFAHYDLIKREDDQTMSMLNETHGHVSPVD